MRNYIKKAEGPSELLNLIGRVNELIPRTPLKPIEIKSNNPEAAKVLDECLKNKPKSFQTYIRSLGYSRADLYDGLVPVTPEKFLEKTIEAYMDFRLDYYALTKYVYRLELERNSLKATEKRIEKEEGRKVKLDFNHYKFMNWQTKPLIISAVIKRRGKENYLTGLAGLIGKFDDNRLRKCKICTRIFWAKKTNAETCGLKKCADDLGNKNRLAKAKNNKEKKNVPIRIQNAVVTLKKGVNKNEFI